MVKIYIYIYIFTKNANFCRFIKIWEKNKRFDLVWLRQTKCEDFAVCGGEETATKIEMKNWTEIANKLIVIKNQSEIYGGDGEK